MAGGGAAGAAARWAIDTATGDHAFPWALLAVNVVGAFVLGLVAFRSSTGPREPLRLTVGVGFCGGLTTFSAFAVEVADLLDGRTATAGVFVAASVLGAIAAVVMGAAVRRRLDPLDPVAGTAAT